MSFEWNDKRNDVDDVNAEDINNIANELIRVGKQADKALSVRNYDYSIIDLSEYLYTIHIEPNTVSYAFGDLEGDELNIRIISNADIAETMSEESVLILDLTSLINSPTLTFSGNFGAIKWMTGEPPTIEAGKVYMFSFVLVKKSDALKNFYLGIGGEFS